MTKNIKQKTVLITGAFGQDGYFLTDYLIKLKTYNVICTGRSFKNANNSVFQHKNVLMEMLDIENDFEIFNLVKKYKPDEIYHLASFSSPIVSWEDPKSVIKTNGMTILSILDAIKNYSPRTRLLFASSAKILETSIETPQNERTPINPKDPYSLGKYLGHQALRLYRDKFGIFASNAILFNHESHLKNPNFVVYKICQNAILLKEKEICKFSLMNPNSTIDFGDPRDFAEAMNLITRHNKPDDYIVATNKSYSIKEICLLVGKSVGIKNIMSHIEFTDMSHNAKQIRIKGDNSKLISIGWKPKHNIDDTISMMVKEMNKNKIYEDRRSY